jgi:hypothetical protein
VNELKQFGLMVNHDAIRELIYNREISPQNSEVLLQAIPEAAPTNINKDLIAKYVGGKLRFVPAKEVNLKFITGLLNLGYKINAKEISAWTKGLTALSHAIAHPRGSSELIDFLVANGAKMTEGDWKDLVERFYTDMLVFHGDFMKKFVPRLSKYRYHGLKYADLPS